jgi:hypothetical protein
LNKYAHCCYYAINAALFILVLQTVYYAIPKGVLKNGIIIELSQNNTSFQSYDNIIKEKPFCLSHKSRLFKRNSVTLFHWLSVIIKNILVYRTCSGNVFFSSEIKTCRYAPYSK